MGKGPGDTTSYWQQLETPPSYCEAEQHDEVDVAILGGGFAGLSTALAVRAQRPDARVCLLEARHLGYGASGRNAGFLSPLAAPVWLLRAEANGEEVRALGALLAHLHALAAALRELSSSYGDVELASARLSLRATGALSELGLREFARLLDHAKLDHTLASHASRLAVEMDAYVVHPFKLVHSLARKAKALGIELREECRVTELHRERESLRVGLSRGGELRAKRVVLCTNAYGDRLYRGERVTAMPMHSFMLASAPHSTTASNAAHDFVVELHRDQSYFRMHRGRVLYGAMDTRAGLGEDNPPPSRKRRAQLEARLRKSFGDSTPLPVQMWSGRLHATPTGLPIVRASRRDPRLILNLGYGGTGVALSLVFSPLAAALATGTLSEQSPDLQRFYRLLQDRSLPVRDALRLCAGLVRRLAMPFAS